MAFSDIARGVGKSYLYTNLARDGVRLWNRFGPLELDLDKKALLRRVGVVPYEPGRRTASDLTLLLLGGIVGAAIALARGRAPERRPRPGDEPVRSGEEQGSEQGRGPRAGDRVAGLG